MLTDADRRGLSALFWAHINLYGRFELDMNSRLDLPPLPGPQNLEQASFHPEPAPGAASSVAR